MLPAPSFKLSTREVPVFDKSITTKGQDAASVIGDFGLVGKFLKKSVWKSVTATQQFGF
jgi:hypothetical protein